MVGFFFLFSFFFVGAFGAKNALTVALSGVHVSWYLTYFDKLLDVWHSFGSFGKEASVQKRP